MKKITCLAMSLALLLLLTACGHEHTWQQATCTEPEICTKCEEVGTAALGHTWQAATCTESAVCTRCGAAEGTALGHIWADASCTAPRTCALCLVTEGSPLEHTLGQWRDPAQDPEGEWYRLRICTECEESWTEPAAAPEPEIDLGTAGKLDGTTLLVTIFANDVNYSWDFESEEDRKTLEMMAKHLDAGVQWLTKEAAAYGAEPQFLYDWQDYPELVYFHDFEEDVLVREDGGGYWTQEEYIERCVPTEDLKELFQAQNVIYMFYFNTDEHNTVNSWSLSKNSGVDTEYINIFVRDDLKNGDFYYMPASSFAHEILHCFGAYDLYYASDVIPQKYVDHCAATGSDDIMYTVSLGEKIPQKFTRLTAYYVGLVESCPEVDTWGLGKSSHLE